MTERPTSGTSQLRNPVVPVVIGGVIGIVAVLWAVGVGPVEIAVLLLPMVVFAAAGFAYYRWARRRGDL